MNNAKPIITDGMIQGQLKRASEYTDLPLDVSPTWSPGDSRGTRYVLKDTSSDNNSELTRPLYRTEVYQVLLSMNELFYHIHVIKLKQFQRVEGEKRKKGIMRKGRSSCGTLTGTPATIRKDLTSQLQSFPIYINRLYM